MKWVALASDNDDNSLCGSFHHPETFSKFSVTITKLAFEVKLICITYLSLSSLCCRSLFIETKKKTINLTIEMFCTARASLEDGFQIGANLWGDVSEL